MFLEAEIKGLRGGDSRSKRQEVASCMNPSQGNGRFLERKEERAFLLLLFHKSQNSFTVTGPCPGDCQTLLGTLEPKAVELLNVPKHFNP